MSSLDSSSSLYFSSVSSLDNHSPRGPFITKKDCQSSWDDQGSVLKGGKLKSRLVLGRDPRFFVAAQKIADCTPIETLANFFKKSSHIIVGENKQDRLIINIKSVAKRLHLSPEEIKNQSTALNSHSFLEFLDKKAEELGAVLNSYENIIENFTLYQDHRTVNQDYWVNDKNPSSDATHNLLSIRTSTLMKVIKVAFTQQIDSLNVHQDVPTHIYEVRTDHQHFYVHRDSNNQVQLAVFKKNLSSGSYGVVSKLVSFNEGFEELALKRSINGENPHRTLSSQLSLKKEMHNLHLIHQDGRVWGAQNKPKVLGNISHTTLENKELGILMPLYSTDYFNVITQIEEEDISSPDYLEKRLFEFHQLLSCLKHLESIQMVHGDIKLENIFVNLHSTNRNEVHLSDFGGSLQLNEETLQSFPNIVYSPAYCPAKDLLQSRHLYQQDMNAYIKLQHKRDVFALGFVLYGALLQVPPFKSYKDPVTGNDHPNLKTYNKLPLMKLPPPLASLIDSMLSPNADQRPLPHTAFNMLDFYIRTNHPQLYQDILKMIEEKGYLSPVNINLNSMQN